MPKQPSATSLRQGHNAVAYRSRGCRCDVCRTAHRIDCREARQQRAERLKLHPWLAEHGRVSTYNNWLCRCDPCVEAHAADLRDRYWAGSR